MESTFLGEGFVYILLVYTKALSQEEEIMQCMNCRSADFDTTYTCPRCGFSCGYSDGILIESIIYRLRDVQKPLPLRAVLELRTVIETHLHAVEVGRTIVDDIDTLPSAPIINGTKDEEGPKRLAIGHDRIYFEFGKDEITVLPITPEALLLRLQVRRAYDTDYVRVIFENWLDGTPSVNFRLSDLALAFGQRRCNLAFVPYDALVTAVRSAMS